ncbi:YtpI family protein [Neobacillus sp. PS3-40]|uniref:YtpI family protein n=1 Tax=Neobacillus sp. PS3-40 TaxID=3070679 RepID=UPI0027E12C14|nr:YtpI family protein [Neobacillus sp. PS3-40]WML45646.1 YtpI family protein [Neobacillus sp. PS3-40]
MPVLVILIVILLAFYVFYKIKYVRSNRPVEKKWLSAKSRIVLGLLVCLFGVNQLFLFHTIVTYLIAAIFIILGGLSAISGFKIYKHYLPFAIEEAEILKGKE